MSFFCCCPSKFRLKVCQSTLKDWTLLFVFPRVVSSIFTFHLTVLSEAGHMRQLLNLHMFYFQGVKFTCFIFRVDMKHRFRRDLIRGEAEAKMSKQKLQQRMREQ